MLHYHIETHYGEMNLLSRGSGLPILIRLRI